jgi:hypothetical protein
MGIDIVLMAVSQRGTSGRRRRCTPLAMVLDGDDFFADRCQHSELPMLGRAKPYGQLVLTPAQMDQFIAEVSALRPADTTADDRLARILALADRCRATTGSELHLQGD